MTKQEKRMMRTYFSDLTLRFCVPLGLCMLLFIVRLIQGGNTPLFSLDFFILLGLALCLLLCQPHYLSRCWKAWKDRRRSDIAKAVVSVSGLTYDPVLYGKSARPGQAVKLMIPDTEQNAYYLSLPSKTKQCFFPTPTTDFQVQITFLKTSGVVLHMAVQEPQQATRSYRAQCSDIAAFQNTFACYMRRP